MNPHSQSIKRARHIRVRSRQLLSPHLCRIVFDGDALDDYPFACNGAHLKIWLPLPGQAQPSLPLFTSQGPQWPDPDQRPIARTYTLRHFDPQTHTLSIDFVLHDEYGPAAHFARTARPGDIIGVSEPADPVPMLKPAQHYLLAGDLSALPAIHAMLEDMAADAHGHVLLHLPDEADLPATLLPPEGVTLRSFAGADGQTQLIAAAHRCVPANADCFVWLAGEAHLVAALRHLARQQWQIPRTRCYAVPYWHIGQAEETYHQNRHVFMDSDAELPLNTSN